MARALVRTALEQFIHCLGLVPQIRAINHKSHSRPKLLEKRVLHFVQDDKGYFYGLSS
jgi:hypothetical protein